MGFGEVRDQLDAGSQGIMNFLADLQTLESFKKRIDNVLSDLETSAAGPNNIGQDALSSSHFGVGFSEASALFGAYRTVHSELEKLSKVFADQIEAMSMLVNMANNDYRNVDEEQRLRLWEIRRSTKAYAETHRQAADEHPKDTGKPTPEASPTRSDL